MRARATCRSMRGACASVNAQRMATKKMKTGSTCVWHLCYTLAYYMGVNFKALEHH